MLWDTAGQEEFNAITKAYYRGAQVIVNLILFLVMKFLSHLEKNIKIISKRFCWPFLWQKHVGVYVTQNRSKVV